MCVRAVICISPTFICVVLVARLEKLWLLPLGLEWDGLVVPVLRENKKGNFNFVSLRFSRRTFEGEKRSHQSASM